MLKRAGFLGLSLCGALLASCVFVGGAGNVQIARDGKAAVDIVVADKAIPAENMAQKELAEHLEKVTGAKFAVVKEGEFKGGKPAIYLGQTEFAKKNGVDFSKLGEEQMIIKTADSSLIISGGRKRGTLYAAYEFLEKFAGCHWLAWDATVTPKTPDLSVPETNIDMTPAFSPRLVYIATERFGGGDSSRKYHEFHIRNRGQSEWNPDIGGQLEYNAGHPHTFYLFVDPKEWFEKHPEYYSMDEKGKRTFGRPLERPGGAGSELCLSNPELPGVMAKSILKFIKEKESGFAKQGLTPSPLVDISAEDNASFICKCPECVAISKEEGSESGLLARYINKVARILEKERPGIMVRTLSYVSTDAAPLKEKTDDNVIIWWCDLYGKSDCFRPLEHPVNKGQLELLRGWAAKTKNIQIWDYWNMGGVLSAPAVPEFVPVSTIAADARLFRASNVKGYFAEFEMGVTTQNFFDLDVWAGKQLAHNPDQDADRLVSVFMDGYYGPAAKQTRAFYDMLEKAMLDEKESMDASRHPSRRSYLNMDFLSKCRDTLLLAEAAVPEGSKERIHVWQEMIVVYNCILNQWDRLKRQNGREFAFSRQETLDKYAKMREAVIKHKYAGTAKRQPELMENLKVEMEVLKSSLPLPEQFKKLADDAVLDFPWTKLPPWAVKEDKDASGGKAVIYKVVPKPGKTEGAPVFGIYDRAEKRSGPTLKIEKVPTDEKYHIYKMGKFTLGRDGIIWGHWSWEMGCIYLAPAYVNADGMKENPNEWDVFISVKITGPMYVPGSQKENALYLDRVILVKPGLVP